MPKTSFAGVSGILDQSMGLAMHSERDILYPPISPGSPLHFDVWHLFTIFSEISVRSAQEVPRRRPNTKRASIMTK